MVDKKDDRGNKTGDRVCVDLRKENELLFDDNYPIPTLQDVFNKLGEYNGDDTHRSKIDCTAAYHGVKTIEKEYVLDGETDCLCLKELCLVLSQ